MTFLVTCFTWLGAVASVLFLVLLILYLFDKAVSAVLRTIGWMGALIRFIAIGTDERWRLSQDPKCVREQAIHEAMNAVEVVCGPDKRVDVERHLRGEWSPDDDPE